MRRPKPLRFLLAVVGLAALARALVIWLTRPEFAGWFNHTYYYFVQVRGILVQGSMPFSDLPLLFHAYATGARLLMFLGSATEPAIVNASRFAMSVIPALTAVPVFFLLRGSKDGEGFTPGDRLLVASAAILPLNIVHMPELLQKNVLGMFLFACLLFAAFKALEKLTFARGAAIAILLALIAASHFGTLAVALMLGLSVVLALIVTEGLTKRTKALIAFAAVSVPAASFSIYFLVPERFARIVEYSRTNFGNSLAGRLILEGGAIDKLLFFAAIAIPLILLLLLAGHFRRLNGRHRTFLLANVFLAYLLAAPILDTALIPRFLLFLPLPMIVILSGLFRGSLNRLVRVIPAAAFLAVCLVMMFGEVMGVVMRNGPNNQTQAELERLRESGIVSANDLIVTSYGANPACNWFLGSKSALITAVEREELESKGRFFVLVTETAAFDDLPADRDGDGALNDVEKYYASRRPIVLPAAAKSVFRGVNFELFELAAVPENWRFDGEGRWTGYGER